VYSLSDFEEHYDDLYAKQYGKYRIIRIKEAVEKFLECGDYLGRGSSHKMHKSRL